MTDAGNEEAEHGAGHEEKYRPSDDSIANRSQTLDMDEHTLSTGTAATIRKSTYNIHVGRRRCVGALIGGLVEERLRFAGIRVHQQHLQSG